MKKIVVVIFFSFLFNAFLFGQEKNGVSELSWINKVETDAEKFHENGTRTCYLNIYGEIPELYVQSIIDQVLTHSSVLRFNLDYGKNFSRCVCEIKNDFTNEQLAIILDEIIDKYYESGTYLLDKEKFEQEQKMAEMKFSASSKTDIDEEMYLEDLAKKAEAMAIWERELQPSKLNAAKWEKGGIFEGYTPKDEIQSLRTQNSKKFRNPDGSITAQIGGNYHYQDENATWQDIDFTITKTNIQGFAYSNTTNTIKTYFPETAGNTGIAISDKSMDIKIWKNPELLIYDANKNILHKESSLNNSAKVKDNIAQYQSFNGVIDEIKIIDNGIENNIIISGLQEQWTSLSNAKTISFKQFVELPDGVQILNSKGDIVTNNFSDEFIGTSCDATSNIIEITLNPIPSLPTTTSNSRCGSGSITLSASPGSNGTTCRWYAASSGGSVLLTGTSYSPTLSSTTTYYVSTYNATTGCESTSRQAVTATIFPTNITITPSASPMTVGNSYTLTASGSGNYQWTDNYGNSFSGSPITITAQPHATYTVTGSASGCTASGTFTITTVDNTNSSCGIIYVSTLGSDANNGSSISPVASLQKAIQLAGSPSVANPVHIRMASGTYNIDNSVALKSNVIIEGQWNANTTSGVWTKGTSITTINRTASNVEGTLRAPYIAALEANNISGFTLQDINVTTANAPYLPKGENISYEDVPPIGTGTSTNSYTIPGLYEHHRDASLYTSAEIGLSSGTNITAIGYNVSSFTAVPGGGNERYVKVYIKETENEPCTDIDGNTYETIMIGEQLWMAENLKVTHYNDGTEIPNITDESWSTLTTGAYAEYDNESANVDIYGRLYNWHAVNASEGLCPNGWHVPTDSEWKTLEIYLGMTEEQANETGFRGTDEGGKLKEIGTEHWEDPNNGATNESGFTALPGGMKHINGDYSNINVMGCFWSSTEYDIPNSPAAWDRFLRFNMTSVHRSDGGDHKNYGFSVRCVSNTTIVAIDDINKHEESNEIQIYPNPFVNSVNIVTPENASVEIFDINGKLIEQLKGGEQVWTPKESSPNAYYFVQVKIENEQYVKKIVYKRY